MCVYYCMEKLNRVGRLENVFILLFKDFIWGSKKGKKTLGSAAKNGDGRMIVNKHTFFLALYILVCFIYFIWPC